ncbi:MAG: Smr/MutS family protein [Sphingopyxis sp.]|nr:Smr/MutS family protein [Sphingopyxis sp.]
MARKLGPDESALWQRVAATVAPIAKRPAKVVEAMAPTTPLPVAKPVKGRITPPRPPAPVTTARRATLARASLDGTWDRRLRKGLVRPDQTIDLHGHTLASAHSLLEDSLARALLRGARVLLVIAGRVRPGPHHPPFHGEARPRGAIRASLPDWLASSAHADAILATRPAAPVHGGGGAIYVVLRRPSED